VGHLLYLGSVGLIAAGIIAVFFGSGFFLLVPTAGGTISGFANRAGPEITSLPPPLRNEEQQTFFGQAGSESKEPAQKFVALPAPSEKAAIDRKEDVSHLGGILVSKAPTDASAAPRNVPL